MPLFRGVLRETRLPYEHTPAFNDTNRLVVIVSTAVGPVMAPAADVETAVVANTIVVSS